MEIIGEGDIHLLQGQRRISCNNRFWGLSPVDVLIENSFDANPRPFDADEDLQIDSAAKIEYIVLSRNRQRTTSNAWLRLRPYR
jgi:hypothetical protein